LYFEYPPGAGIRNSASKLKPGLDVRGDGGYVLIPLLLWVRPALHLIPGHEDLVKIARQRNPHKRLTVSEDVARCIPALCLPATYWMTGNTLHVDGGENVVG
jgi:NAD(P)-dependent dehydrogenase (short-subunit alcohol dehydrogenase family)